MRASGMGHAARHGSGQGPAHRPAPGGMRRLAGVRRHLVALALASQAMAAIGAAHLPVDNPVPGGVARVPLGQPEIESLAARFGSYRVPVYREFGRWTALVGLPISIEPGRYILVLKSDELESPEPVEFSVKPARTPVLQEPPPPPGAPGDPLSKRERRKTEETIRSMVARWTAGPLPEFRFSAPTRGELLHPYCLLVIRNTGTSRNHDFLTYLAPAGTPVLAPQGGTVAGIFELPVLGQTLFIDHNQGLISMLGGLGEITVETGQLLQRDEMVGRTPQQAERAFARVDWALFLNGQKINPEPFVGG